MRRRTIFILLLLFLAILGASIAWLSHIGIRPAKVSVSFQGFTNDIQGARLAAFHFTNRSDGPVRLWYHHAVETSRLPRGQGAPLTYGPGLDLRSGEGTRFLIHAPTNVGPWKATLFYSSEDVRYRLSSGAGYFVVVPGRFRPKMPLEFWQSPWLDQ